MATGEDCDDDAPAVYRGAEELCGDGVVNACDGDVATAMSACGLEGGSLLAVADRVFVGATLDDHAGNEGACAGDVDGDARDKGQMELYLRWLDSIAIARERLAVRAGEE